MSYIYDNCNDAWPQTVRLIARRGVPEDSRNGKVLAYPVPITFSYLRPTERVLFCEKRNINPYLHFFEPLWILAGRRDVEFLADIVSRFREYSDNGNVFNAAYGYRLRFPDDQIMQAILRLKRNPNDRQVVLQIRKPEDMWYTGKDTACNLCAALSIRDGALSIHVFNRSNDVVWGGPAGGANFPQFTTLLEYLAGHIGVKVGMYHHTTNNMHAYVDTPDWAKVQETPYIENPYPAMGIKPWPLFDPGVDPDMFDEDLYNFFASGNTSHSRSSYFRHVVNPMWESFRRYKAGEASCYVPVGAQDWDLAIHRWLKRKNKV
jgi:thymidylate synthase